MDGRLLNIAKKLCVGHFNERRQTDSHALVE